jgi:uncharacterized protein with NAD-binding domain and iron-sulfur cluster
MTDRADGKKRVVVVGAGIGGMARTSWAAVPAPPLPPNARPAGPTPLRPAVAAADRVPGEHGFRFFPSFYRHMTAEPRRAQIAISQRAPLICPACGQWGIAVG